MHVYVYVRFFPDPRPLVAVPAFAQQTGSIQGKVTDTGGGVLPGVTVEARVRRAARPARHGDGRATASYQLPALPPGDYTLTFTLSGMQTATQEGRACSCRRSPPRTRRWRVGGVTEAVTVTG